MGTVHPSSEALPDEVPRDFAINTGTQIVSFQLSAFPVSIFGFRCNSRENGV